MSFIGKTALVTGGGGYIGRAVALKLAKEGAKIAVCDINEESAKKTVEDIRADGGISEEFLIDVTSSENVDEVFKKAADTFGGIDISVHIAGGSARIAGKDARYTCLTEQEDYVIDSVLKVNLYGAIYVSRAAARLMKAQNRGGRIINFSSIVGINGLRYCVEYAVAKGGVIAMTKALAKEMAEYKVTVNSIAPGIVQRPAENNIDNAIKTNFLGEKCLDSDIANLVAFIASDESRFITGQTHIIDGGRSLAMKGTD